MQSEYTAYEQKISYINVYNNCAQVIMKNENNSYKLLTAIQASSLTIIKVAENFSEIDRIESDR